MKWILASDRLPNKGETIIFRTKGGWVTQGVLGTLDNRNHIKWEGEDAGGCFVHFMEDLEWLSESPSEQGVEEAWMPDKEEEWYAEAKKLALIACPIDEFTEKERGLWEDGYVSFRYRNYKAGASYQASASPVADGEQEKRDMVYWKMEAHAKHQEIERLGKCNENQSQQILGLLNDLADSATEIDRLKGLVETIFYDYGIGYVGNGITLEKFKTKYSL